MSTRPPTGHYPIADAGLSERDRLRLQDEAWSSSTQALLDAIGVAEGWRCLDLGCGPAGLTRHLAARAGASGHVTGLEYNPQFIEAARQEAPANVEIIQGDAFNTGLPDNSFDLVHMRFLASVAGKTDSLMAEAVRLTRPGGFVAVQEADAATLRCYPPLPAWQQLVDALTAMMPDTAGGYPVAHKLFAILRAAGLGDVRYNPVIVGVAPGDPWRDYLPSTAVSARSAIIDGGLMPSDGLDQVIAECRAHLARPDTVFVSPMLVQVWGRKPGP